MYFSTPSSATSSSKTYSFLWLLVATTIVIGSMASSYLFFQQYQFSKKQLSHLDQQAIQQLELMASTRKSNALILMNNLYDNIDEELKNNPNRRLSDQTIERIATLSLSFEPYHYLENGQLSEKKWSPERGKLLLLLTQLEIDSSSFILLKQKISFEYADLQGLNLENADLSGVNLKYATLQNSNLSGTNLSMANLQDANLRGVNLNKANLHQVDLKRAKLPWANLQDAILTQSNLKGVDMSSAKAENANFYKAILDWSNLNETFLQNANFSEADLIGTSFKYSNLSYALFNQANLNQTDFRNAKLYKANLTEVKIDRTIVGVNNWFSKLNDWEVIGIKELQANHSIFPFKMIFQVKKNQKQ